MAEEKPSVAGTVKVDGYEESFGKNAENALKKTPVIGKGYSTIADAAKKFGDAENAGDLANASAQLVTDGAGFVASAGMDMASFVLDPIGWLVSNGLNILLELVQPLQDALHFVTGDGPALKTASANFESIGKGFVALADDFVATGDKAVKDWQGDAGEAARNALGDFSVGIKGIGSSAGSVAETLTMWSMVMTVIEEVVKAIISELVSTLIYIWLPALAASIVSLGSSVAAAMTASIAKAASAFSKITKHLGKLGQLLEKFMGFMAKWTDDLIKQGSKLSKAGRVTPGMEKAVGGAMAKATGSRLSATGDALVDVAKGVPGQVLKQTVGVNPKDLGKGSAYQDKAAIDMLAKTADNLETQRNRGKQGDIGGAQDADETRKNLDMDQ
ncbi:hypothetical protein [Amycolatopsis sp. CA-230715]|uniref:hypothetical protein n=1 Tax=Amycolatopsis sp. CA-230715 TaxID=2745196 RepID=UPI001C0288EB|nr:hypothetical protein [Amycolatopsis sp. CA-230715]QWF79684.1 hypothetical protein HUW46_03093 [Amycolatopsis sp. CA-230715]